VQASKPTSQGIASSQFSLLENLTSQVSRSLSDIQTNRQKVCLSANEPAFGQDTKKQPEPHADSRGFSAVMEALTHPKKRYVSGRLEHPAAFGLLQGFYIFCMGAA
jgi:hypothetical protein